MLNTAGQVIACLISPYVSYLRFRTILVIGYLVLGTLMAIVAILAYFELNTALVFVMMIFLFIFQATSGTYTWVYLGQVACDEGLSIASCVLWTCGLILTIYTNTMFTAMTPTGVFALFAGCTLVCWLVFSFTLKEIKGLSRDESQVIYSRHTTDITETP